MTFAMCLANLLSAAVLAVTPPGSLVDAAPPKPEGKMVDLGGHRLHVHCSGKGSLTVVVENGLGDFSFDWTLVQTRVSTFARICTYDRAGYAWSDPGPKPRTFDQLNLELREALIKLDEKPPYVLVGHSFGGPVVRNFAMTYPADVAGIVFVDAAFEGQRVGIGGDKTMQLGVNAPKLTIPPPHLAMKDSDKSSEQSISEPRAQAPLDPMYKVLPPKEQGLQLWAQNLPAIEDAEDSQRQWSEVAYARLLATPQDGKLGRIPVLVLTRAQGGYQSGLDVSAEHMERERKDGQAMLSRLSSNSKQIFIHSGHNMELEAPDAVIDAIRQMLDTVQRHKSL
jgi:pimeloyl-ACP methyl ester carboxylesterase